MAPFVDYYTPFSARPSVGFFSKLRAPHADPLHRALNPFEIVFRKRQRLAHHGLVIGRRPRCPHHTAVGVVVRAFEHVADLVYQHMSHELVFVNLRAPGPGLYGVLEYNNAVPPAPKGNARPKTWV